MIGKMRIIAGKAKGTKLYTLEGDNTRPTLDRVKESLFNIIQDRLQDICFLDLFSGSGAIGLEALSRGAKKAILCDKSKEAYQIIQKNACKTHLSESAEIYRMDFQNLLRNEIQEKIDIIFLDPPYQSDYAIKAVDMIFEKELLQKDGMIIIETDDQDKMIKQLESRKYDIKDIRKYGRAYLIFLKGI